MSMAKKETVLKSRLFTSRLYGLLEYTPKQFRLEGHLGTNKYLLIRKLTEINLTKKLSTKYFFLLKDINLNLFYYFILFILIFYLCFFIYFAIAFFKEILEGFGLICN